MEWESTGSVIHSPYSSPAPRLERDSGNGGTMENLRGKSMAQENSGKKSPRPRLYCGGSLPPTHPIYSTGFVIGSLAHTIKPTQASDERLTKSDPDVSRSDLTAEGHGGEQASPALELRVSVPMHTRHPKSPLNSNENL